MPKKVTVLPVGNADKGQAPALTQPEPAASGLDAKPPIEETTLNPKVAMEAMVKEFRSKVFRNNKEHISHELEVRFTKRLTKLDYDNVVQALYKSGYKCDVPDGVHILRIMPEKEFVNKKDEVMKSKKRIDVIGIELVEEYCRLNDDLKTLVKSPKVTPGQINFTIKSNASKPVDFKDFNFRVSYQIENNSYPNNPVNAEILDEWSNLKKTYRYLNRVRFHHPELPFFADLSIVRTSRTKNRNYVPKYSVKEAEVFSNQESYEIEIEVNNKNIPEGSSVETLLKQIRKQIRIVLSAFQGTNYPIGNIETKAVLDEYMEVIHGPNYDKTVPIRNRNFIGPSTVTLTQNSFLDPDTNLKNIMKNYCVTDKADGLRSLLFISSNGRLYMIDMNMNVIFTGMHLGNKEMKKTFEKTILDGEYVKYGKDGNVINLFAVFDIYYDHGQCVSTLFFNRYLTEETPEQQYRYDLMVNLVDKLCADIESITGQDVSDDSSCVFNLRPKKFLMNPDNIFQVCKHFLENMQDDYNSLFEYNTDGLIFTPINAAVGGEPGNKSMGKLLHKQTWEYSFKWKDTRFNTIDFLVKVKKTGNNEDDIQTYVDETLGLDKIKKYKTLVLHCGYSKEQHGFLTNPFIHMIHDSLPTYVDPDDEDLYKPVPFTPTLPSDNDAKYCNIFLDDNGSMRTLEGDYFEENTIIEFSYDKNREGNFKWQPLRVRYDKTSELLSNAKHKGYGNDYRTANGVWTSINYPIDREMLMTGKNIPITSIMDDDVYYNKGSKKSYTKSLRDFHNLYVKKMLIVGASKMVEGNRKYLIDYAVGKAGDLSKWKDARLDFIFGIDVHRDNIENHIDGACARYLNDKMKFKFPEKFRPKAMFITGNSEHNIRDGSAFASDDTTSKTPPTGIPTKASEISKAIFGNGTKDKDILGKGVYDLYGYGEEGFHISSCQFALHYFFKDNNTVHNFLRNVSECTKLNGYFIGTCYDGQSIFNLLKDKEKGESFVLNNTSSGAKIVEITKDYNQEGFHPDITSIGYRILVFQETINKQFAEYLVNFEYLTTLLGHYGFEIISNDVAKSVHIPNGTGLFKDLFENMEKEINRPNNSRIRASYGTSMNMTAEEKQVSFLNRYFVFKKVRDVKASDIMNVMTETSATTSHTNLDVTEVSIPPAGEVLKTNIKIKRPRVIKKVGKQIEI